MVDMKVLCPECHKGVHLRKKFTDLPSVDVAFGAKIAGRIVNERTGETKQVLVIFRQYKGHGPLILSAVNPDMVVHQ